MDKAIENKLNELINEIGTVPESQQKKLLLLARETDQGNKKLGKSLNTLQESLDYLRLSVKYLVFDLEATRRENVDLKKALDGKGNDRRKD